MYDASAHGPRSFDPVAMEHHETDAWAAYYRHEWDLSDGWVSGGCDRADPLLAAERRALVASYSSLLDAVAWVGDRRS